MSTKNSSLDQVILVNSADEQIGVMDKIEAHRGEAKLHRAISVYLFNKDGKLLIQQRSSKKIVGALQWANTCCGNLRPGESYQECALRRLREELGIITAVIEPIYKFQYAVRCNEEFSEREIDQVFFGQYDETISLNPDEVNQTVWCDFNPQEIPTQFDIAPWFQLMLEDKKLSSILEEKLK